MKRLIDYYLQTWKHSSIRKPLLLHGARQVGKTFAVRNLGKSYTNFVEINLEFEHQIRLIFEQSLDPQVIINQISLYTGQPIHPESTLLFLDEIQVTPQAITALRYFYEKMPQIHIIAAGSLLDFAIAQVGIPVGRIQNLHMYPLSFIEYLAALNNTSLIQEIFQCNIIDRPMPPIIHEKILGLVAEFIAFGGMPEVLHQWISTKNALESYQIHTDIITSYRQDFQKYARTAQVKYVDTVFRAIPAQLGQKFKYSSIEGEYRKRELAPALDLLITAGVAHKVFYAHGQGVPLGAQIDPFDYKVILLDTGLTQANLGLNIAQWLIDKNQEFINKGSLVESFVGQELLVYQSPYQIHELCYWHKTAAPAQAEIDYLITHNGIIIPIEVKSGSGRTLKSMHYFLAQHSSTPFGIKFSTNNYSQLDRIHSYPLYAIIQIMMEQNSQLQASIQYLIQ